MYILVIFFYATHAVDVYNGLPPSTNPKLYATEEACKVDLPKIEKKLADKSAVIGPATAVCMKYDDDLKSIFPVKPDHSKKEARWTRSSPTS